MILAGFEPGPPGLSANTITTELKRILPNAVVRYCILNREAAMPEGVVIRNYALIQFILILLC